jgi:hypothetical protein
MCYTAKVPDSFTRRWKPLFRLPRKADSRPSNGVFGRVYWNVDYQLFRLNLVPFVSVLTIDTFLRKVSLKAVLAACT